MKFKNNNEIISPYTEEAIKAWPEDYIISNSSIIEVTERGLDM